MPITELQVTGYRSLRNIQLPLKQLNVITGPNGSGKSNLYRALWLIAQISEGEFAKSIAAEGGLLSAIWAGGKKFKQEKLRMELGFRTEEFGFELSCGFPSNPGDTKFEFDPQIKEESIWVGKHKKPSTTLVSRKAGLVEARDDEGRRVEYPLILSENESVLSQLREPQRFPELYRIRDEVRRWRFYHTFRTDDAAPMRSPQVSVRTHVLSHDGRDLAAALETIREHDERRLSRSIESALPGRELCILSNNNDPSDINLQSMELVVGLMTQGLSRVLLARELSDGTLKYLCLVAALLTQRPPALIALNEPEASLHPDLLPALAELIVEASERSQVWVSSHSQLLVDAIVERSGITPIRLELRDGETVLADAWS